MAEVARNLFVRQLGDDRLESETGGFDGAVFLRRSLGAEHRQAQLKRAQLSLGQSHWPQEMIRHHGDGVGVEVDLEALHKTAGNLESLGDRLNVLEQRGAVDAGVAGDLRNRMDLAVRQCRDEMENSPELLRCGVHRRLGGEPEW